MSLRNLPRYTHPQQLVFILLRIFKKLSIPEVFSKIGKGKKIPRAIYMETDIEISLISQLNSQVLFDDFYDTVIRTTVLNKKIRCPNAVILTGLSLT